MCVCGGSFHSMFMCEEGVSLYVRVSETVFGTSVNART